MSIRIERLRTSLPRLRPSLPISLWTTPLDQISLGYENLTFTQTGTTNLTITGNGTSTLSVFKTSGSAGWDTKAYVNQIFTAPVTIEFNKNASAADDGVSYAMIAFNTDPTSNTSYTSLDHASYPYFTNNYYVYNNGTGLGPYASWSTSNKFYIVYGTDGFIRHYNGSTELYSVNYGTGQNVYVDSAYYSVNATNAGFSNIRLIKKTWNGTSYI